MKEIRGNKAKWKMSGRRQLRLAAAAAAKEREGGEMETAIP